MQHLICCSYLPEPCTAITIPGCNCSAFGTLNRFAAECLIQKESRINGLVFHTGVSTQQLIQESIFLMLQWTSKPSDGNRSLFKYPYQVAIKQQLRVIIRNGIAVGEEQLYMHPENLRNGDATLYEITGKRDG